MLCSPLLLFLVLLILVAMRVGYFLFLLNNLLFLLWFTFDRSRAFNLVIIYVSLGWNFVISVKTVPENDEIVVLRDVILQRVVFLQKGNEFRAWSIISDLVWFDILILQHPEK